MIIEKAIVESVKNLQGNIFLLKAHSPQISSTIKPSQFCNIKVNQSSYPLLRRPFSVCDVDGEFIFFMFDVHGEGTEILSKKVKGEVIELLGPLGNGFDISKDVKKAVIVAGGLGVAPFPFLMKKLPDNTETISLVGGRNKNFVVSYGIKNFHPATEDGSLGFKGNVIELMETMKDDLKSESTLVFACGPTPMLRALQDFCEINDLECQISAECQMACGFGICQGCPIEIKGQDTYSLVCKDGPVFNAKDIIL